MKKNKFLLLLSLCTVFTAWNNIAASVIKHIDWPRYMSQFDMKWERLPMQWSEGAFVGNGQLGIMFYVDSVENRLVLQLGRQDVTDHRKAPDQKTSMGTKDANVMLDYPRLDVGRMFLYPTGKIESGTVNLSLWNGEITVAVKTSAGMMDLKIYTLYDHNVQIVEASSTEKAKQGTKPYRWKFQPGYPQSARTVYYPKYLQGYELNPKPVVRIGADRGESVQALLAGGDYATAWKEIPQRSNGSVLLISIANEVPQSGASVKVACQAVDEVIAAGYGKCREQMERHWHEYFKKSFISIPDKQLEAFYWAQIYKLGTCVRPDGPVLDLMGPFYRTTSWPGIWWNLNVQLTYWPVYPSNHLELGTGYIHTLSDCLPKFLDNMLDKNAQDNETNRKRSANIGDYGWALHNLYLQLSYAADSQGLKKIWLPLAKQVYGIYKYHFDDVNGVINLRETFSPEYNAGGVDRFDNTNYNLAILHWLLNSMTKVEPQSPDVEEWKDVTARLYQYPTDENGLMIAENVGVNLSHRHFSHLLGIYPMNQLDPDDPQVKDLLTRSINHWHTVGNGNGMAGFSITGAASLFASIGDGDQAYEQLHHFLTVNAPISRFLANTFYVEGGGPCIEAPLCAASATLELMLQSRNGKIRIFPAVPKGWKDAEFADLRAEGAFLVSAQRQAGRTLWVEVTSIAGGDCVVQVKDWNNVHVVADNAQLQVNSAGNGEFRLSLAPGQKVMLSPNVPIHKAVIKGYYEKDTSKLNAFGLKTGKDVPTIKEPLTPHYDWVEEKLND
jgi:alpha-L-fucosidase 2